MYAFLADAVLVVHFAFVVFVVIGGVLVLRWPRVAWLHLPAAAWGVVIQFAGWICPLTPLENHLRALAGQTPYMGGFVDYYLMAVLYPEGLTRQSQYALGLATLLFNLAVYVYVIRRRRTVTTSAASRPPSG